MRVYRKATEAEARAQPFLTDVESIHNRIRRKMKRKMAASGPDRDAVRRMLEGVLAAELAWARRNRVQGTSARGPATQWFLDQARAEQTLAERLAARIEELGGRRPARRPPRRAEDGNERGLCARLREDLVAERVTIGTYRALLRLLGDHDPDTRRLLEEILAREEEHAEGLVGLLRDARYCS